MQLHELKAAEAGRAIAAGLVTSEALVRACLERIQEFDPELQAWCSHDADLAIGTARQRDRQPSRGPLHGVPIGVKDVIDTRDFPTAYNSAIYRGHRPVANAAIVERALAAGMVVLGKTATQEFATRGNMPPTRNPAAPNRTPGGSSSGSAAAVAARMAPLALSTQTAGSILRPASYCGVIGFKPSFGCLDTGGMKLAVPSFDTLGVHVRCVADAQAALGSLSIFSPIRAEPPAPPRLRFALYRTPFWNDAGPAMKGALSAVAELLAASGHHVAEVNLPACFDALSAAHDTISDAEARAALESEWLHCRTLLSAGVQAKLARGDTVSPEACREALHIIEECRSHADNLLSAYDCILTPSAPDMAPLLATGDPGSSSFNKFWTSLGNPAISLPVPRQSAPPIGIQLVGRCGADHSLLRAAGRVEELLWPNEMT
ncbi:MAG: Asp-tRNAAsn/Glu-tRNAGln amidotransferase subunit [Betaproteobacteria bacterium]|nr:Asp-tRNAAsn/Glu-tRNAGln amidotransferase subunit [Betaproteobacteria bacterium]